MINKDRTSKYQSLEWPIRIQIILHIYEPVHDIHNNVDVRPA